jgi:hypothetical protein
MESRFVCSNICYMAIRERIIIIYINLNYNTQTCKIKKGHRYVHFYTSIYHLQSYKINQPAYTIIWPSIDIYTSIRFLPLIYVDKQVQQRHQTNQTNQTYQTNDPLTHRGNLSGGVEPVRISVLVVVLRPAVQLASAACVVQLLVPMRT